MMANIREFVQFDLLLITFYFNFFMRLPCKGIIDNSDLYPGRWRFIADVDPDNIITEYWKTANNSLDISPITLGDPLVITLFEFVDQHNPLRAFICSGQRVIVNYAIDSDFPVTARIIYEGHIMNLRGPSVGVPEFVIFGLLFGVFRLFPLLLLFSLSCKLSSFSSSAEFSLNIYLDKS